MNTLAGRNQDPNNSLFRALGKRTKENIRTEDIKKEKLKGKGLLERDHWSRPPLYLSKYKQKEGFIQLLAVPYLAKLLSNL